MVQRIIKHAAQHRLLRYLIAGGSSFGAEYVSFIVLFYFLHIAIVASNTLSFLIGFMTSFIFNRSWTFKQDTKYKWAAHHQLTAYLLLALFNLLASDVIVYLLHKEMPALIGKLIAAAIIACWNFFIFRATIFSIEKPDLDSQDEYI